MKAFLILLFSCATVFGGETFISIKAGETNYVSYGLSYIDSPTTMSPSDDFVDLFLTLRNHGAKFMSFGNITLENFSLRDAGGQEMKVRVRTSPTNAIDLAYGEAAVIHLEVPLPHAVKAPQPWTLRFKNNPGEHNHPLDLRISDIKIRRH